MQKKRSRSIELKSSINQMWNCQYRSWGTSSKKLKRVIMILLKSLKSNKRQPILNLSLVILA